MRPAWQPVSVRLRRTSGFEGLFFELRANLGFMFSSEDVDRLIDSPPPDADAFIDAVLVAGGFSDPEMVTSTYADKSATPFESTLTSRAAAERLPR